MKPDYTHISILLDRSLSMRSIAQPMIDGFNEFINKQKEEPGSATVSLSQFDDEYDILHEMVDIHNIPILTKETFVPRGNTALNDSTAKLVIATGQKLADLSEDERPSKVLFVVISDGDENCSVEYPRDNIKLRELTKHQEEKYNWEFVYIGANQDSYKEASSKGMSNYMNYAANDISVGKLFSKMSASTTKFRSASRGVKFEIDADADTEDDITTNTATKK